MADAGSWLRCAGECLASATAEAGAGRWRSACSRAYYAAHNAAHAVLVHLDPSLADALRSVSHGELPPRLYRAIKGLGSLSETHADLIRRRLVSAYNIRVQSDYHPRAAVGRDEFGDARAPAREILALARRLAR